MAWSMSSAAASRISPTTMRSGRMRSALRTRSRIRTSPLPSMFGGRASRRSTCSWCSWSSAASSMVMMRSSLGDEADDSTLSVVVLPAPVPPLTRMLSRPRTHAARNSATVRVIVPNAIRSSAVSGSVANLRMVSIEPSTASGGMIALTRLPSGRRASTIGLASSTRRPTLPTILSMVRRRCASSANGPSTGIDPAGPLDEDLVRAVDHDLGDVDVPQVRLDRAVAEDVVGDLLGDAGPVRGRQGHLARGEHLLQGLADLLLQLRLGQAGVVELRAEGVEQRLVDLALEVGERVRRGRAAGSGRDAGGVVRCCPDGRSSMTGVRPAAPGRDGRRGSRSCSYGAAARAARAAQPSAGPPVGARIDVRHVALRERA